MNFNDIINYTRIVVDFLAIFGITFEILPIKISPLKWFGERLSKSTNERIDAVQAQIDAVQAQVNTIEYENEMRDLRSTKSRIHQYGHAILKGDKLSDEMIKSAFDDLDVYDYYKDKYHVMKINGKKIKINGEVEVDRELLRREASKSTK